jgi:TonB family protein
MLLPIIGLAMGTSMRLASMGNVWVCLLGVGLAFVVTPARADLYSASVAYKKGDFPAAFAQFRELAELGQPTAQYDLAVMYAQGQGVTASKTFAHAWASLASAGGEAKAAELRAELEPNLTPTSLQISADLQAKFNQSALDVRLMPRFLKNRDFETREAPRRLKAPAPDYPEEARRHGVQGEVYVEFIVAPDGRARLPRILHAVPAGYFENTVRENIMRTQFLPGRINGEPVASPVSTFYNFKMNYTAGDYEGLERRVEETLKKANDGDPSAQMLYGMMIAGLPQLKQSYDQALPWFLKAAQAGAPYAQYQVGTGLLMGRGCRCDAGKGEIWLEKAAQNDQPDAQVSLAEYLMREKSNPEAATSALVWLDRAVKQGSNTAKLRLAAILAASPSAEIRNPTRALALSEGLDREYGRDPSLWEIRAAANASRGDFKSAVKAQAEAISGATRLEWDLAALNARQSAYRSNQAWTGDLLVY